MIIDFDSMEQQELPNFKGGEGSVGMKAYADDNCRIMRVVVHPHSSLGWHQHAGNSEIVYILSGQGKVKVEGGFEELTPGTCHYCAEGQFHAIMNDGEEDLVAFAVVPQHGSLS